jgi:protein-disulfide isomerase
VYRNYPLPTHKNAHLAAQAAEAAGKQQKFWEMHDWLFEHQADWAENSSNDARNKFIATAEQFGLNKDQFTRDLDSSEIKKLIQEDIDSGNQADLQGTPTFYLNGKLLPLPASYDQLKTIVQQATTASSTP